MFLAKRVVFTFKAKKLHEVEFFMYEFKAIFIFAPTTRQYRQLIVVYSEKFRKLKVCVLYSLGAAGM